MVTVSVIGVLICRVDVLSRSSYQATESPPTANTFAGGSQAGTNAAGLSSIRSFFILYKSAFAIDIEQLGGALSIQPGGIQRCENCITLGLHLGPGNLFQNAR
jgi:hypothetical protein